MENCKDEFLKETNGQKVLCAIISRGDPEDDWDKDIQEYRLRIGYSQSDLDAFLENINFEYDSRFGMQEVFGFIWYMDGTWSGRCEYDGSEWWEHRRVPRIPEELKQKQDGTA